MTMRSPTQGRGKEKMMGSIDYRQGRDEVAGTN
jgi:hypothetical protein